MNLEQAQQRIDRTLAQMNAIFGKTVFDEWIVLTVRGDRAGVLAYEGPRPDSFRDNFAQDLSPLTTALLQTDHRVGDFEFSPSGVGEMFDAFLVAGPGVYVVFNNTKASTGDITARPQWRKAQAPFAELAEAITLDPLRP